MSWDEPIDLEAYSFLWDGSESGWVIVEDGGRAAIINVQRSEMLLMEVEAHRDAILGRMRAEGVTVLFEMPDLPPPVILPGS